MLVQAQKNLLTVWLTDDLLHLPEIVDSLACSHQVWRCLWLPCFYGGLSPVPYRLVVPARHTENVTNFGADKINAPAKIHWFSPNYSSQYLCSQASYQKMVKTKSNHHHCPIPVHIFTTWKLEAGIEIHPWGLWLLKWGVVAGGERGLLVVLPSTCLASRWGESLQAMHPGQCTSTILQLSLSLSPPSSASQQAGRGSMKKSAIARNNYSQWTYNKMCVGWKKAQ